MLDRTALEGRAAIARAANLEVAAAIDDQLRVRLDDRIAARDLDGVIRRAAARAAGLAVERGLEPLAGRPRRIDLCVGLPAAGVVAPYAGAAGGIGRPGGSHGQPGRVGWGRGRHAEPEGARAIAARGGFGERCGGLGDLRGRRERLFERRGPRRLADAGKAGDRRLDGRIGAVGEDVACELLPERADVGGRGEHRAQAVATGEHPLQPQAGVLAPVVIGAGVVHAPVGARERLLAFDERVA